MDQIEQYYYDAGVSFAKKLEVCRAHKWTKSIETIEEAIESRIDKIKEQPNLIKALKNGLRYKK